MRKMQHLCGCGADQLIGRSKTDIEVKGNRPEPGNQLGEDHDLLLRMWIMWRAYGIEQTHKVGLLVRESDATVTQIESFHSGNNRGVGQLSSSFPHCRNRSRHSSFAVVPLPASVRRERSRGTPAPFPIA